LTAYIARVVLENFQSHGRTELVLVPGFNVLVGESNQGKSSVLRALVWLFYNEPCGTAFIRSGRDWCRVSLEYSDGTALSRTRTRARNSYLILYPGGASRTFETSDAEVPQEVRGVHGIAPVLLADGVLAAINVSRQFDQPFLLTEPEDVRAEAIGRLRGAHVADRALDGCLSALQEGVARGAGEEDVRVLEQACRLLAQSSASVRESARRDVEDFVNSALRFIFGPEPTFKIGFARRDPKIVCEFSIVSSSGAVPLEGILQESQGAGIVDVISLALRIAFLEGHQPRLPGPLLLDEPVKHLSDQYALGLSRFLKTVADTFDRQIVMATHDQHLTAAADMLYVFERREGETFVHSRGSSIRGYVRRPGS